MLSSFKPFTTFKLVLTLCFSLFCASSFALPTLMHNVKGYTIANGELKQFDSILFEDGVILATGSKEKLSKLAKISIMIDGQGKTMLPGLIDAHGHILGLGLNLSRVDVRDILSLDATLTKIADYAKNNPQQRWLQGRGWNQVLWPSNKFPHKSDLDKIINDRPVLLRRVDGHAAWANSNALKLAGISKKTRDPEGGKIVRDENGEATGILIDKAIYLVSSKIPKVNRLERETALEYAFDTLLSQGITSVHDAGVGFETYKTFLNMSEQKRIPIRLYAMIAASIPEFETVLKLGKVEHDFLRIQSIKMMLDGALGSRGAAMIEPYSDDADNSGLLFANKEDTAKQIKNIAKHGFQVNIHAIGDKANQQALDGFASLKKEQSAKTLRHRIEHAQVLTLEDIKRMGPLEVIASMQPTHATSDMNMAEDRVGAQRIKGAYAWRKMLDNNVRIASGSDFPVELENPFFGIHAAVTRQSRDNQPNDGWIASEALTLEETLKSFTTDAAYAAFWEDQIGSLEKGKQADFILVDQDIFAIDPQKLWQTQVLETWIAGVKLYQKESTANSAQESE